MCPISPAATGRAAPQPAAQHEAGGDARADVDVGQRGVGSEAEVGERAEGRRVDVVLDVHGDAGALADHRRERHRRVDPEVDGRADDAAVDVDASRHADGHGRCICTDRATWPATAAAIASAPRGVGAGRRLGWHEVAAEAHGSDRGAADIDADDGAATTTP